MKTNWRTLILFWDHLKLIKIRDYNFKSILWVLDIKCYYISKNAPASCVQTSNLTDELGIKASRN